MLHLPPRLCLMLSGAFAAAVVACGNSQVVDTGCLSDLHCKGARLCDIETGTCFDPPTGAGGSTSVTASSSSGQSVGQGAGSPASSSASSTTMTASSTASSSMASTGAGGTGGMGGSPGAIIESWAATAPNNGSSYALPSWLTLTSPTADKSTQTSESTLVVGLGPNVARARNSSSSPNNWGLNVESTRTNLVLSSNDWQAGWANSNGMSATAGQPDPASGNSASRFSSPASAAGFYSRYFQAVGRVASAWTRAANGGSPATAHFRWGDYHEDVTTSSWARLTLSHRDPGNYVKTPLNLETRNVPVGAGAITQATASDVFGAQLEAGALYASSYIPTTTAPRTRQAETLNVNVPLANLFPGGWVDVEMVFAPRYASNDVDAGKYHDLWFAGSTPGGHLRVNFKADPMKPNDVDATTAELCLTIGMEALCTPAISWSAETPLTIRVQSTSTGRQLTIEGVDQGTTTVSDPTPTMLFGTPQDSLYLLGDASGAQECGDLRSITIRTP